MPAPSTASDTEDLLARLIAEAGPLDIAGARVQDPLADPDALLAALAAEAAVPLPPPPPVLRPVPRERLLPQTPVPVARRSAPPREPRPETPAPLVVEPESAGATAVPEVRRTPEPAQPPPLPPRIARPVAGVSDPPIPLPEVDGFEAVSPTPAPISELAVDDFDILEAEESVGPGTDLGAPLADASLGDLDAPGESTVDRDLKAFFADDSVEFGGPADAALLRPEPGDSTESPSPDGGRRNRRDKSLLTNVKKLFKK